MSTQQFEITGNETLEELESMLDSIEDDEELEFNTDDDQHENTQPESKDQSTESELDSTTKTDANEGNSEADTNAASATAENPEKAQEKPVILAKDNVSAIPFEVLESERKRNQLLNQQIEQQTEELEKASEAQRKLEVLTGQLERLGVQPDDLPENAQVSEEQLKTLREDYPEMADALTVLVNKIGHLEANHAPTQANNTTTPEMLFVQSDPAMRKWHSEGADQWNVALDIDDQLLADKEWKSKPVHVRLEEVKRRTQAIFSETQKPTEDALKKSKEREDEVENSLPLSPTEVGHSHSNESKSLVERAQEMTAEQAEALMESMTDNQIEELLSQM